MAWGAGDLIVVGHSRSILRAAELIAYFLGATTEEGKHPFSQIVFVRTHELSSNSDEDDPLLEAIEETVQRWRGSPLDAKEKKIVARRVERVVPPDLTVQSVLSIVSHCAPHSAIIIGEAARYRSTEGIDTPKASDASMVLPEDFWIPHLHALCKGAIEVVRQSESYVAIDAGEKWPSREKNRELLMSVDGCAVLAAEWPDDPQAAITARVDAWNAQLAAGEVQAVP